MEICEELHRIFHSHNRYCFPLDENQIPDNGIYILFEKGEYGHGGDRVVRVGTHTGNKQLKSRLRQHFINENKDRSIFRKNIGRALLNADNDPFLNQWEYDLTSRKNKAKYQHLVDMDKQKEVEKRVSQYIQQNISFIFFEVEQKELRLELESKLISTFSLCSDCSASRNWLGLSSPKEKIRESGLWLVNQLYKEPLSPDDYDKIVSLLR
jgi:hypothetical protein